MILVFVNLRFLMLFVSSSFVLMTGNRLSNNTTNENAAGYLVKMGASDNEIPAAMVAVISEQPFTATVGIVQVSQCLISSNMLLNPAGPGISLLLIDLLVAHPQLAVMANLFTGALGIIPKNYPALASQIAPLGCRAVLNTVALDINRDFCVGG